MGGIFVAHAHAVYAHANGFREKSAMIFFFSQSSFFASSRQFRVRFGSRSHYRPRCCAEFHRCSYLTQTRVYVWLKRIPVTFAQRCVRITGIWIMGKYPKYSPGISGGYFFTYRFPRVTGSIWSHWSGWIYLVDFKFMSKSDVFIFKYNLLQDDHD